MHMEFVGQDRLRRPRGLRGAVAWDPARRLAIHNLVKERDEAATACLRSLDQWTAGWPTDRPLATTRTRRTSDRPQTPPKNRRHLAHLMVQNGRTGTTEPAQRSTGDCARNV